jgi:predicted aspartyl protease
VEQDDFDVSEEPAREAQQGKPAAQGTESGLKVTVAEPNASSSAHNAPVKINRPHGPYDRYIAPEMKEYTAAYRVAHNLILPTALNDGKLRLFILDTGATTTVISPKAAHEVAKMHSDARLQVEGLSGKVEKAYVADEVTFTFGRISREAEGVLSIDTSHISKNVGMEITGFLGADTLYLLTIQIDYRDGLVKFDYDPNRGYQF